MTQPVKPNLLSRFLAPPGMAQLYDAAASNWQAGLDRLGFIDAYQHLANRALAYQPIGARELILDAGTGTGAAAAVLAQQSGQNDLGFDLLDPSTEMLELAGENVPGVQRRITGYLGEASVAQQAYDRVICAHVIEHCDAPQAQLNWLFERIRPGGMAILAVSKPHWCTTLVRWRWGNACFRPAEMRRMLASAGFSQIEISPHRTGPPSRISCGYLAKRPH